MDDVPVFRFDRHAKPSEDQWRRFFEALADDAPVYLTQGGRVIGRTDAESIKRHIDALAFFLPIEVDV